MRALTVNEAIMQTDALLKNNPIPHEIKLSWLTALDHYLYTDVILTHEGGDEVTFTPYEDGIDSELLVPSPYDSLYVEYLKMKVFYETHEYTRYNNSMSVFNKMLSAWRGAYHSSHLPKAERGMRYM